MVYKRIKSRFRKGSVQSNLRVIERVADPMCRVPAIGTKAFNTIHITYGKTLPGSHRDAAKQYLIRELLRSGFTHHVVEYYPETGE